MVAHCLLELILSITDCFISDDRSPEVFKEKIESATQMKAVIGVDPRPNCLVIDEIDGAPQVKMLVKFLQGRVLSVKKYWLGWQLLDVNFEAVSCGYCLQMIQVDWLL